jgi:hypothetical protein
MTESTASTEAMREAEPRASAEPWTPPTLRELDARMTMLSAGNGVDGGSENTSAS